MKTSDRKGMGIKTAQNRRLLTLLNSYSVTTLSLSRVAGVPIQTLQSVLWELAEVDRETAEKIVAGFNHMTGGSYTRERLGIRVLMEGVSE